jgi:hypothetical protein
MRVEDVRVWACGLHVRYASVCICFGIRVYLSGRQHKLPCTIHSEPFSLSGGLCDGGLLRHNQVVLIK